MRRPAIALLLLAGASATGVADSVRIVAEGEQDVLAALRASFARGGARGDVLPVRRVECRVSASSSSASIPKP